MKSLKLFQEWRQKLSNILVVHEIVQYKLAIKQKAPKTITLNRNSNVLPFECDHFSRLFNHTIIFVFAVELFNEFAIQVLEKGLLKQQFSRCHSDSLLKKYVKFWNGDDQMVVTAHHLKPENINNLKSVNGKCTHHHHPATKPVACLCPNDVFNLIIVYYYYCFIDG